MRCAFLLAAAAALAACGRPDVVAEEENADALPAPVEQDAPNPTGAPPANNAAESRSASAPAGAIPPAIQGRWGLTPADCSAPLGEAKGLLVVGSDELRFYESRAVPAADVQTSPESISGTFSFTGEGQQWARHLTLEFRRDRLVRTERNPIATFRYVRCD